MSTAADLKQPVVADPAKNILVEFLKDLVKLRLPATATALVASVVLLAQPFADISRYAAILTGVVVVVGTIAYYAQSLVARSKT